MVIACSVTGYCLGMALYEGATKERDRKVSLGEFVVTKLSTMFEGFWYCVFSIIFALQLSLPKSGWTKSFFHVLQQD